MTGLTVHDWLRIYFIFCLTSTKYNSPHIVLNLNEFTATKQNIKFQFHSSLSWSLADKTLIREFWGNFWEFSEFCIETFRLECIFNAWQMFTGMFWLHQAYSENRKKVEKIKQKLGEDHKCYFLVDYSYYIMSVLLVNWSENCRMICLFVVEVKGIWLEHFSIIYVFVIHHFRTLIMKNKSVLHYAFSY